MSVEWELIKFLSNPQLTDLPTEHMEMVNQFQATFKILVLISLQEHSFSMEKMTSLQPLTANSGIQSHLSW